MKRVFRVSFDGHAPVRDVMAGRELPRLLGLRGVEDGAAPSDGDGEWKAAAGKRRGMSPPAHGGDWQ